MILLDDVDSITDQTSFLWTVFTRFDPGLDIHAIQHMRQNAIEYRLPFIVDARMKPEYPAELVPRRI